ncbi:DoxX family protein [Taibaiella koreensis]|uniref:DoxX family protein n=1 Tax=Taibaiella koreensis TaxID=1268548 RepID=UPI00196937BE|nr:DoxX family protein [Taibaiella koreensis]
MAYFTGTAHLPWLIALLVILIEFFGSLSLILGLASRIWSLAFICLFTGIILTAHKDFGFFMNWFGNQKGEGFEYHLLIIGLSLAILVNGSGRYALDRLLLKERPLSATRARPV